MFLLYFSMFSRIVSAEGAFFRSQQKDEPDLSDDEKLQICSELFFQSPKTFLARYGKYLLKDDIPLFSDFRDDYEVDFHLRGMCEIEAFGNRACVVRNRRYNKLRHLVEEGQYFSDYEMRKRDPLLYESLIGRFQSEQEVRAVFHSNEHQSSTLSDMILKFYDTKNVRSLHFISRPLRVVRKNYSEHV
ncbi:unnamed protein product [Soboliphyme baturini]|uniref:DUF2052 domain-containing protein n=1 Tax=Soboliphyme baturini TaxID=241478 RepID=A0A183IQ94_9BILA|nr:unnamed protein product [Soboliphyme baturini]